MPQKVQTQLNFARLRENDGLRPEGKRVADERMDWNSLQTRHFHNFDQVVSSLSAGSA